jgi:hypothetical protein
MRFEAEDFQGLTPAIDPRRSDKLFALGGKNYVLDSFGPRSVFGNRMMTPWQLGRPEHTEGMRLKLRTGDRTFTFTSDAILEWSEALGGWRVLYSFPSQVDFPYRWTGDYLDGYMYFAHPAIGSILVYDVAADVCLPLEVAGAPTEVISLCVCAGRVIAMTESAHVWSEPGDGLRWIPSLGGAGFQAINERVPGYPLMINSYGRGTLVWTTGGVLRSEFTADSSVFRHRPLVTEYRPINPYCTFRLDNDTIGFLDERGLFSSQGETPRPLTPLFNEFLIDYLQRNNLNVRTNVRVEFDDLTRRLYISTSLSEVNPIYEKAFVLYIPLDKWGTFDEEHYGILPALISDSSRADDYFGFVDSSGNIRYWNQSASREILPTGGSLNAYYPVIQMPAIQQADSEAIILGSTLGFNTVDTSIYTQRAGFYDAVGTSPTTSNLTGLDSNVQLGFVRARGEQSYDRLLEIIQIYVGSVLSNPNTIAEEDWNAIPDGTSDEDYNEGVGGEDFGLEDVTYVNHGLTVIGTLDGRSAWEESTPELIRFDRASREWSGGSVGLFHILKLDATEIGEAFHVRVLELTAIDAGRLN